MTSIHGVIHGRTIELAEDPGIADGQRVQVEVRAVPAAGNWGGRNSSIRRRLVRSPGIG